MHQQSSRDNHYSWFIRDATLGWWQFCEVAQHAALCCIFPACCCARRYDNLMFCSHILSWDTPALCTRVACTGQGVLSGCADELQPLRGLCQSICIGHLKSCVWWQDLRIPHIFSTSDIPTIDVNHVTLGIVKHWIQALAYLSSLAKSCWSTIW